MMGKRIGFVDYKLENYHANVFLKAIRETLNGRGFSVTGCTAMDEAGGKAWAAKNSVEYFGSAEALNERVDCYMVLAPSNPEVHLELCRKVLPFGKITYVDKTFAPDLKTAQEIFSLADKHQVPVQTTSALRYTAVQNRVKELGRSKLRKMHAFGGGGSFEEYAIHPIELVISCMGPQVTSLKRASTIDDERVLLNFTEDRAAEVSFHRGDRPFSAALTLNDPIEHTEIIEVDSATLFTNTAAGILDFFEAGKETIDRQESLMIRRILDAAEDPQARGGFIKL
jgi:predicted dehydrogenase